MQSAESPKASLPALTGARFFAAFAVVVWHYGADAMRHFGLLAACARSGPLAVSFFYVLSGAVITWGCTAADGTPSRPSGKFWSQRAARILPAYALALALSVPPFAASVMHFHAGSAAAVRFVLGVLACFALVQAFVIPLAAGLNTPGWSISCEAFFYANWPTLVTTLRSRKTSFPWRRATLLWLLGCMVPALAMLALHADLVPHGPFATLLDDVSGAEMLTRTVTYFPPFRLPEFALGIVVGHALRRTPNRARSITTDSAVEMSLVAGIVAVTWLFGSGVLERASGGFIVSRLCIESGASSLLFALLVWQLARGAGVVTRLLSQPWLVLLGEASYGLYVLQDPVLTYTTAVLKRVLPAAITHWDWVFWVYGLFLVAVSVLVHKKWEMPLRSLLLRRFAARPERAAAP
ncbi:MAG TPA: acyltransferase [Polyangiaceae bacterium]|nr:acyltransferase [Polyangiaceae bacterium]